MERQKRLFTNGFAISLLLVSQSSSTGPQENLELVKEVLTEGEALKPQ